MPGLVKDSTITLVTRGLIFATAMVTSIIVSRVLGPSLKGSYSLVLLVMNVASLLVLFGLSSANVYYGARNPNELPALAGNSFVAAFGFGILGITIVELATFVPGLRSYLIENGVDVRWVRWLVLLLPLILLNTYLVEIVRAAGDIIRYNLVALWNSFMNLAGAVILVWLLQYGLSGAISAWVISQVALAVLAIWLAWRAAGWRFQIAWPSLRRSFTFGVRLYPGNLAQFLNYRLDVFLVAFFLTPAEVGFYVTATTLAEKLWEIPHAIRTVLLYQVAAGDAKVANFTTARVSRVLVVLIGSICLLVALVSYPLIFLLYGADYLPAAPALILLMPGIWALGIGKLLVTHLAGLGQPEVGTVGAIISLSLTFILDFLLIPRLGILGASIASSAAYSLSALVISVLFLRITGLHLHDITLLRREDVLILRKIFADALYRRLPALIARKEG
jgi:O-antigen/teichoic acid export membrane protein